ncbi:roadblock/LC7 domain-containing protein [Methanoculleus sp.]|uniref:roadblock/LC7 domain-containing protein n=1 Tax=Methanoculleus sp. TaxID=90427 RepID=UPI00261F0109|nr:roadblock/LC7 domain-containing protein [Methanoculleus sp.]MDI6867346.1 roadblock/LC7 domain-containing protein [Methanoculleus sp.]
MLPDGISLGRLQGPLSTLASVSPHFTGALRITEKGGGTGFVLLEDGKPYGAAFEDTGGGILLSGDGAYRYLLERPSLVYELIAYTAEETRVAREASIERGCIVTGVETAPPSPEMAALQQIARQPGVVAVSLFHDGFAIQSVGSADFEKVAAVAEDLLRAGSHITADMEMGGLSQVILETPRGKFIIAPYNDLYICILAEPDASLGLIRLSISGMVENRG